MGIYRRKTACHIISLLVMSRRTPIFSQLEKFTGSKYPAFLKKILINSGFDCESSLLLLNEEVIKNLESEVNLKKELLKNTVYDSKDGDFKFLIGHRQLLLNIPPTINARIEKIKSRKKKNQKI